MTESMPAPALVPTTLVEELIRTLVKGLRAFQMYLPNNPIYQRGIENVRAAFRPIWDEGLDQLTLQVVETDLVWDEQVVYHQPNRSESLAWALFKDGMRVLTLLPHVEDEEIIRFLETVQRARNLPPEAGDDLLTLLWEQDFTRIQYHFAEFYGEQAVPGLSGEGAYAVEEGATADPVAEATAQEETHGKVVEEAPPRRPSIIELDDFDSTLYWLEENEIRAIAEAVELEYQQDLRANCVNILFDIFEQRREDWARGDVLGTLELYLPHLLNAGDFRAVAQVLRELRLLARGAKEFTPEQRERMDAFTGRLSEPGVFQQILQSVIEAQTPPSEEDLGELFQELRPAALESALIWLPRIPHASQRKLLEGAVERLAEGSPQEVLRLLRLPESEALPAVIALSGRLRLQGAVPGLTDTLDHPHPGVRLATVRALDAIATPGALSQLERALEDTDREVRVTVVQIVGRRGYKSALRRVEPVIQGKLDRQIDLTERMRFFEAYALIAGAPALPTLAALLSSGGLFRRRESPEVRACAALALGRLRSPEARDILQRHREDKELVVRTAVARALRDLGQ
jgi:hypothetical protein